MSRASRLNRVRWTSEQLDADLAAAKGIFRRERLEEPLEAYLRAFEQAQRAIETLLVITADLASLDDKAHEFLARPELLEGFRYLTGPPISLDDLKTVVDVISLNLAALRRNNELVDRLVQTIRAALDSRRFPWVTEGRDATPSEREAAILATAALIASQRVATSRRSEGKSAQEERVRQALLAHGLQEVQIPRRQIQTLAQAPQPGTFCSEVTFGSRKADLVVGLWNTQVMAIECKVSNSSTNSVKRLNNDAAIKAEVWTKDFGQLNVIPVAVLSGVYKRHNLEEAQHRGLALCWSHRLGDLTRWVDQTR